MHAAAVLDMAWACLLEDARRWDAARLTGVLAASPYMEKGAAQEALSQSREDELRDAVDPPEPDEAAAYERLEDYLRG